MPNCSNLSLVSIPALLLVAAISTGWVLVPWLIKHQVLSKLVLSPDANPELYSAWISPPMPIFLKVYMLNVSNPEQVEKGGLPKFAEVGPYVFRENRTKVNVLPDEASDTITYHEYVSYHFDRDMSNGLMLHDQYTIINVPFVAAAMKISHDLPWPMNDVGKMILLQKEYVEPLFIRRSVAEILFTGWNVPFLEKIDEDLGMTLLPNNTFSYFMGENGTTKGPYTVSRGIKDKSTFGQVLRYQNRTELNVWEKSSSCNKIVGTDGSLFSPFVTKNSTLRFFNSNMCQSVYATFEKETEVKGVKAFRFSVPDKMIADPRESEENRCYCVHIDEEPEKCLRKGAYDIGPCREGAPVAMSPPHFLNADPEYIAESGLVPNASLHAAFIKIEPLTGVILEGSSKVQINLVLRPVKGVRSLSKVPDMLFPLFWADEGAELDHGTLSILKSALSTIWLIEFMTKWILLGATVLISFGVLIKRVKDSKRFLKIRGDKIKKFEAGIINNESVFVHKVSFKDNENSLY